MTNEVIGQKLERLNDDGVIQSLIAQANARYILLNTREENGNHPPYTIKDESLNVLALQYLNLGCSYAENREMDSAIMPLERGASILEAVHAAQSNRNSISNYYGIIASMAYYVGFQYSKAFILISKFDSTTPIGNLLKSFLRRDFLELNEIIYGILVNESYSDKNVAQNEDNQKIYEYVVARALDGFVRYYHSGDARLLESSRELLNHTKEIALLEDDPGIWWIIRLLLLISDGFNEASLWNVLVKYFDLDDFKVNSYIKSLVYMEPRGIYELFLTQRKSLDKVLDQNQHGCVVSIPTSSGKTRIAEIAILHCIQNNPEHKVLYIAPFRSLAFEVESGLEKVFEHSGITVSHLYGGSLYSKLDEMAIEEAQVIIATPEKAKAILRGGSGVIQQIYLAIIDEGHLLGGDKRLIMNEIFYEELRYHMLKNGGRFLLLSAVLPNSDDIAQWLTGSTDTVYRENWRPSDERLGILEWNNNTVNLNWESQDTERASFNRRFIVAEELPRVKYQRKDTTKYSLSDKNEAVAATAFKLRTFGPVLIFVGLKASVFVMGRAYLKAMGKDAEDFKWKNKFDWRSFEVACIEAYGVSNEWLYYAQKGILCHHAGLHADVRLPMERLMRTDKPLVIISTSTLGQGVNLGVSTVIFSTLHQARQEITARDFWNIAGRAGRAFVDHEGKILVALDTNGMSNTKREKELKYIKKYFDKDKIDLATSGILILVKVLKVVASKSGTSFNLLLQLITENRVNEIGDDAKDIEDTLDWIDDTLLSLLFLHNSEGELDMSWVEAFFNRSLAVIQSAKETGITEGQVLGFLKARVSGVVNKVGDDRSRWHSIVQSGIPLNSDLILESRILELIDVTATCLLFDDTIKQKIQLLKEIEAIISDLPVLTGDMDYLAFTDIDFIRTNWLMATPISEFLKIDNGVEVITKIYTFSLPWVLNGIAKKMRNLEYEAEAGLVEEIAILVESGLPCIKKVKIYQAGIRSRTAANELGELIDNLSDSHTIKDFRKELLNSADHYKAFVSPITKEWLELLSRYSSNAVTSIKRPEAFVFGKTHEKTKVLVAKIINGRKYLMNPDLTFIYEGWGDLDFHSLSNRPGVQFIYNAKRKDWVLDNDNPYLQIIKES
ncbi:DEAD/DEAH box helicase [Sphingobacterium faecium]|uniref:DEAD/DEAH box helicase n=1 Tax=Sphingobacterium faecium TaxID=34087 RepID=UPI003DA3FC78